MNFLELENGATIFTNQTKDTSVDYGVSVRNYTINKKTQAVIYDLCRTLVKNKDIRLDSSQFKRGRVLLVETSNLLYAYQN